jgi:alcohol dehydrogenase class IV
MEFNNYNNFFNNTTIYSGLKALESSVSELKQFGITRVILLLKSADKITFNAIKNAYKNTHIVICGIIYASRNDEYTEIISKGIELLENTDSRAIVSCGDSYLTDCAKLIKKQQNEKAAKKIIHISIFRFGMNSTEITPFSSFSEQPHATCCEAPDAVVIDRRTFKRTDRTTLRKSLLRATIQSVEAALQPDSHPSAKACAYSALKFSGKFNHLFTPMEKTAIANSVVMSQIASANSTKLTIERCADILSEFSNLPVENFYALLTVKYMIDEMETHKELVYNVLKAIDGLDVYAKIEESQRDQEAVNAVERILTSIGYPVLAPAKSLKDLQERDICKNTTEAQQKLLRSVLEGAR